MTNPVTYFETLTALLRQRGMPQQRVEALVRELQAHAEEAGGEVDEEFGPAAELAAQLAERDRATDAAAEPGAAAETWVWTADALKEQRLLAEFGAQGWEAERLDRLGRFVCRRDVRQPMRWEYRRETVGRADREELTERLAPEGWEPFGVWGPFAYYKRPEAASAGPAAQLAEPPVPPRRRVYIARWIYVWVVFALAVAVAALAFVGWVWLGMSWSARAGAVAGLLLCALSGWALWKSARRGRQAGGEARQSPR
ncbi:MAG: hypothetical protein ACRDOO_26080 [Actinomadura sp.]